MLPGTPEFPTQIARSQSLELVGFSPQLKEEPFARNGDQATSWSAEVSVGIQKAPGAAGMAAGPEG